MSTVGQRESYSAVDLFTGVLDYACLDHGQDCIGNSYAEKELRANR